MYCIERLIVYRVIIVYFSIGCYISIGSFRYNSVLGRSSVSVLGMTGLFSIGRNRDFRIERFIDIGEYQSFIELINILIYDRFEMV